MPCGLVGEVEWVQGQPVDVLPVVAVPAGDVQVVRRDAAVRVHVAGDHEAGGVAVGGSDEATGDHCSAEQEHDDCGDPQPIGQAMQHGLPRLPASLHGSGDFDPPRVPVDRYPARP